MTALKLYKFIRNNNVEWHYYDNDDVLLFVSFFQFEEFVNMLPKGLFDDEGLDCKIKDGYFVFHTKYICEYCGIDLKEVFVKE